jgi:large subunit ribosomal protein L28
MVTGKSVMSGNNVSHSNRKNRRKFMPNTQDTSLYSEALGKMIRLRVSTSGLRTIDHKGGLDSWLVSTAKSKLDPAVRKIKDQVTKAVALKKS